MIQSVHLENFQSHQNTTINFDQGVNSIIGLSDSGKSAIFRALNWVINNKPSGEEFKSYWGGDTEVTIVVDNYRITRGRGKKGNYYILENEFSSKEFKAFGQDVPKEISDVLDISDINLSAQMDVPFLLAQSPGEVAQILNRIVNLDVIDSATSNIRKKKLEIDREYKSTQSEIERLSDQLSKFDYIAEMEKDIVRLEDLTKIESKMDEQRNDLSVILSKCTKITDKLNFAKNRIEAEHLLNHALQSQKDIDQLQDKIITLTSLNTRLVRHEKAYKQASALIEAKQLLYETNNWQDRVYSLGKSIRSLNNISKSILNKEVEVDRQLEYLQNLEEEYQKIFPNICPLCGSSRGGK